MSKNENIINNQIENTDEDEDIQLPADTLLILNEFLQERQQNLDALATGSDQNKQFEEDWQLSQFWYDQSTKDTLASVCHCIVSKLLEKSNIALLSCPSIYEPVKEKNPEASVKLFEYDTRFSVYQNDFIQYDYTMATQSNYLMEYYGMFDLIIVDPPFLSEECIERMSTIIKNIGKPNVKIILCSGEIIVEYARKYLDLVKCNYQPKHQRNLANAFASYANFDLDSLIP